jgi:hypothetical protein
VREFPQFGIKVPPHSVSGMIPRRAHIQRKLGQGIKSFDFRGQKAVDRVVGTRLVAHGFCFKFASGRIFKCIS